MQLQRKMVGFYCKIFRTNFMTNPITTQSVSNFERKICKLFLNRFKDYFFTI